MPAYASFLIRCWRVDGKARRLTIEHIQTGAIGHMVTLEDALGWLAAELDAPGLNHPPGIELVDDGDGGQPPDGQEEETDGTSAIAG